MKEEFLRLTFGYDIDKKIPSSSLLTMVDGIFYLRDMVSVYSVKEIVENFPQVFGLSIDNLNMKVEYIKSLGVDNVGKVVEKCPSVLGLSIDSMNRKLSYYQIYFPTVEFIKNEPVHLLEKNPVLLGYSLYKKNNSQAQIRQQQDWR
jgi:hypothetical protein